MKQVNTPAVGIIFAVCLLIFQIMEHPKLIVTREKQNELAW
jgi:hypothetical protein